MNIFIIESNIAKPTVEILLVPIFNSIWTRDNSSMKETAIKEFTYIEFMVSPKKTNPYSGYKEEVRGQKIANDIFRGQVYTPDYLVDEAIQWYNKHLEESSPSMAFLNAAKSAANKLIDFLNNFDMDERTRTGTPIYKPKDITSALNDTPATIKSLNDLTEKVQQELFDINKTRANKDTNYFEE